ILPTHRLVSGLPALSAAQLRQSLGRHFQVETVGQGEQGARETWELIQADGGQELLGLGTVSDGTWQTARFRAPEAMAELAAERISSGRGLAVSVLQVLVLGKLLPEALAGMQAPPTCRYVHLLREVTEATGARECQLAVLVPPASMRHVEQIAGNLEKMPP